MVLKEIEKKMLSELIKNSRRSDRELAKAIGASQPTATRIRTKLEREGYVKEYTTIPNFNKMGYAILALTFMKLDVKHAMPPQDLEQFRRIHYDAVSKTPSTVMFVKRGMGLGYDAVIISLHQDYACCDRFRTFIRQHMTERVSAIDTFLVNLEEEENSLPFSFSLLATQMMAINCKDKQQA
ncbi:MAG: winged helix-turn-helix transcriptional regulator [Candidatus Bathyarchaeota archaeon]|nr:winged helix-turn-helix transcriptional regulator [Candidatus Bathyarchaeota archaeon]